MNRNITTMSAPTSPSTLRLFVAWPLPESMTREIGRMTEDLRGKLPPASWPRPESIHLTFAFLGDTPADRVTAISEALDSCATEDTIDVRAGRVGVFPEERRPRVAWLGVEPRDPVTALATLVRAALRSAGIAFDEKPFRPHLTIARLKAPWRAADVAALHDTFRDWRSPEGTIDRVVLYSSRLSPHGAVHLEVLAVALVQADRSQ